MTTAIPGQDTAFERDVLAYLESLPQLLDANEGKFVLIGDGTVFAVFDSRPEAMRQGYAQFGTRGFLVQEVARQDLEFGTHWQH